MVVLARRHKNKITDFYAVIISQIIITLIPLIKGNTTKNVFRFAAFCFARSSEKLNRWFTGTKLYKNNLESYVKGKGMTRKTKIKIMVTVTLLMSVGFIMMDQVPVGRIVLACVWVFHVFYFMLGVKTIPKREASGQS